MDITPRNRRLIVFTVTDRQKIAGSSLWSPNRERGNYTRAEDAWIHSSAVGCFETWVKGEHVLIPDGFELEPVELDVYVPGVIPELDQFAESVCGIVRASLVHEDSIMARVIGPCYQGESLR